LLLKGNGLGGTKKKESEKKDPKGLRDGLKGGGSGGSQCKRGWREAQVGGKKKKNGDAHKTDLDRPQKKFSGGARLKSKKRTKKKDCCPPGSGKREEKYSPAKKDRFKKKKLLGSGKCPGSQKYVGKERCWEGCFQGKTNDGRGGGGEKKKSTDGKKGPNEFFHLLKKKNKELF